MLLARLLRMWPLPPLLRMGAVIMEIGHAWRSKFQSRGLRTSLQVLVTFFPRHTAAHIFLIMALRPRRSLGLEIAEEAVPRFLSILMAWWKLCETAVVWHTHS